MNEEEYLWVARDANGDLILHQSKPNKYDIYWKGIGMRFGINSNLFPNVKWEDEEPLAVVLQQAIFKSK